MEKFYHSKRIHWRKWDKLGATKSQGGLGFRDLEAFNRAMFAKQVWRLLKNPNSLARQVLKSKYFLSDNILTVRLGNGLKVKIWGDQWLSTPTSFRVQSPVRVLPKEAKVNELISQESFSWNRGLITQLFSKNESDTILKIPLSLCGVEDKIVWWPVKNGFFSLKSAYFLEMQNRVLTQGEPSNQGIEENFWRAL